MNEYTAKSGKIYTGISDQSLQAAIDAETARVERAKAAGTVYTYTDDDLYILAQGLEDARSAAPAAAQARPTSKEEAWRDFVRTAFNR